MVSDIPMVRIDSSTTMYTRSLEAIERRLAQLQKPTHRHGAALAASAALPPARPAGRSRLFSRSNRRALSIDGARGKAGHE